MPKRGHCAASPNFCVVERGVEGECRRGAAVVRFAAVTFSCGCFVVTNSQNEIGPLMARILHKCKNIKQIEMFSGKVGGVANFYYWAAARLASVRSERLLLLYHREERTNCQALF